LYTYVHVYNGVMLKHGHHSLMMWSNTAIICWVLAVCSNDHCYDNTTKWTRCTKVK